MTNDLYLAFEAGSDSVNVSDQTAWRLPKPGWTPGTPMPSGNTYTDVVEEIPAEALGATSAAVAARVQSLARILNKGQRWANGETVEPALMRYTMPNSAPAKVLSAIIKGWGASRFLAPDYNQTIAVTGRALATIAIQRSGALYHTSWRNENLVSGTEWRTDPGWTSATWSAGTMPNGGLGYLTILKLTTANSPGSQVSVVNGQTYTLVITVSRAGTAGSGILNAVLRNSGNTANISNTPTITITNVGAIGTVGIVYTMTFVATATDAAARLRMSTSADDVSIAELAIYAGAVTDTWHRTYTEETTAYTSSAAAQNPAVMDATFRTSHNTLSPLRLKLTRSLGGTDYQQSAAYMLVAPGAITYPGVGTQGALEFYDWTDAVSGPWTSPAEGNGALGGAVKRYTPVSTAAVTQLGQGFVSLASSFTGPVQAFASIRNNSATTTFLIYFQYIDRQGIVIAETSRLIVPANATNPTWYPIGIGVVGRSPMRGWKIVIQASAAAGSLDIDAVAFIKQQPGAAVIATDAVNTGASFGYNEIVHDHRALADLAPAVYVQNTATGVDAAVGYKGVARLMVTGDAVSALWLATSTGKWRHYDTGGVTLTAMSISGTTRLPAYLTPE
jgi:hypothetical protein